MIPAMGRGTGRGEERAAQFTSKTRAQGNPGSRNPDPTYDEQQIIKALHDSFRWAFTKDRALFESVFAGEEDFFTYFPDSKSTVLGWTEFEKCLESWMDPRNKATGYDIRNLRLVISRTGDVAWFSAMVDDEGEFDGKPWGTRDIRWTGVLEKRGGAWKICQQHMSQANDRKKEGYT
jgi:ketosteroid isomerase-like protein